MPTNIPVVSTVRIDNMTLITAKSTDAVVKRNSLDDRKHDVYGTVTKITHKIHQSNLMLELYI